MQENQAGKRRLLQSPPFPGSDQTFGSSRTFGAQPNAAHLCAKPFLSQESAVIGVNISIQNSFVW
jgi:hypothetical protein